MWLKAIKVSGRKMTSSKVHFRKMTLRQGRGWSLAKRRLGSIPGIEKRKCIYNQTILKVIIYLK